jgi:hypothetical protein
VLAAKLKTDFLGRKDEAKKRRRQKRFGRFDETTSALDFLALLSKLNNVDLMMMSLAV